MKQRARRGVNGNGGLGDLVCTRATAIPVGRSCRLVIWAGPGHCWSMRIVSWNVNGIRAAARKGFLGWLERSRPDVVCLQETKALPEQVPDDVLLAISSLGYHLDWHSAERKGYSGVATFSLEKPLFVTRGLGFERNEGRILVTEHGAVTVYNVYFPNGRQTPEGPDPDRLGFKMEFYAALLEVVDEEREQGKNVVVSGDWNTAHTEVDLARPKQNETVTGFLPEERRALQDWFDRGYVDTFRALNPASAYEGKQAHERDYSWWSYRAGARDRNVGWRIDYHVVDAGLVSRVKSALIHAEVMGSDHCPIELELDV